MIHKRTMLPTLQHPTTTSAVPSQRTGHWNVQVSPVVPVVRIKFSRSFGTMVACCSSSTYQEHDIHPARLHLAIRCWTAPFVMGPPPLPFPQGIFRVMGDGISCRTAPRRGLTTLGTASRSEVLSISILGRKGEFRRGEEPNPNLGGVSPPPHTAARHCPTRANPAADMERPGHACPRLPSRTSEEDCTVSQFSVQWKIVWSVMTCS